ncbi:LytR/AlgR family response regulator transcription factor [Emticicia sp. SJ17W-69]|uniref:LytR/AlgR family response regulator transcription factor n=1 Tax=Emticicia sp. SJ17W-69 TaxID=3421657 RepID=UPI003EBD0982
MKTDSTKSNSESNYISIGGRKTVSPKQVLMLVADINYTTIHLFNGEQFIIATTLKRVQKSLNSHGNFIRTNKKFVVNWDYVLSHCAKQLTLHNNQIIPFSRRQGKQVMEKMAK